MTINISQHLLSLKGQRVNEIKLDEDGSKIVIPCSRDSRRRAIDPATGKKGSINQHVRRQVNDIPLFGYPCVIEIELAQVFINKGERRIEGCDFVDKGCRFTHRFCRLISGLCRHMSIQAVSRHLDIRWETVKNIDKAYLMETLPALDPAELTGLEYIGVDEVARAKGHDYMTVVYDMVGGHLIWVEAGRTAEVFSRFLKLLQPETACKIKAVAMDMGPAYQKAVRESLPLADIVFDRFHVMKNYSKAIHNQRRLEFRKADPNGKELMKGTHYLLLKNADKLSEKQSNKLQTLLESNSNLNALYVLKEQLQVLWSAASFEGMAEQLESWCLIADQSHMLYLKKFAKSLRKHCVGICNYAKHRLIPAALISDSHLRFPIVRNSESMATRSKEGAMGGAVKITRTDMSARDLRCVAKQTKDGRVVRRILGIALVLDGVDRATAARSSGMDRQTLRDWVHRYNAEGLDGLSDRRGKGAKPRLSSEQQTQFVAWVEAGPDPVKDGVVRWRCVDLQTRVDEEFGVKLHVRTIGKYLAKLGFRRLSVRPEHPKTDPAAQQAFKKTLPAS